MIGSHVKEERPKYVRRLETPQHELALSLVLEWRAGRRTGLGARRARVGRTAELGQGSGLVMAQRSFESMVNAGLDELEYEVAGLSAHIGHSSRTCARRRRVSLVAIALARLSRH